MDLPNGNEAREQAVRDYWKVLAKKLQDDVIEFNAQSKSAWKVNQDGEDLFNFAKERLESFVENGAIRGRHAIRFLVFQFTWDDQGHDSGKVEVSEHELITEERSSAGVYRIVVNRDGKADLAGIDGVTSVRDQYQPERVLERFLKKYST